MKIELLFKMKICYMADAANIHTQRWINYFADAGHEIHLISLEIPGESNVRNIKLHLIRRLQPHIRVISFPINLLFDVIQIKRLIKEINPDIIHAHYVTNYGMLGAFTGFHPLVVSAWGSDILVTSKKSKILKILVKFALNKANLITCSGEHLREAITCIGVNPQKMELIFHGVDTKKFKIIEKDKDLAKNLSILNSPTIISTRNFEPIYDIGMLIKSIPLIIKKIPNTKFIIAGKGKQEKYLKDLARSLGVLDTIRFVGWIKHDELAKYLSLSDIYVSTSLSDAGVAISTKEAMACGLPPIVTDIGDNRKWIKDGENGFIFPVNDSESLAEKIIYLLENRNVRKNFGKINRKMIEERIDYYKWMAKMEQLYKKLVREYKL